MLNKEYIIHQITNELESYVESNIKTKTQAEYVRTQWPANWAEADANRIFEVAQTRAESFMLKEIENLISENLSGIDDDLNAAYFIKYFE